jgi:hypothetical protein
LENKREVIAFLRRCPAVCCDALKSPRQAMARTVIARMPLLNRLRNSYNNTVNIAPSGGTSVC